MSPNTAEHAVRGDSATRGRRTRRHRRSVRKEAQEAWPQNLQERSSRQALARPLRGCEPAPRLAQATLKEKQNTLLEAVRSLYEDRLEPLDHHVRRRIEERTETRWTPEELVDVIQQTSGLRIEELPGRSKRWIYLEGATDDFVDATSLHDPFPVKLWHDLKAFVESNTKTWETWAFSSSRYDIARILQKEVEVLQRYTLGEVCHAVHLAVKKHQILGYRNGQIVPYHLSLDFEKQTHAARLGACCPLKLESENCLQDWERAQAMLTELMEDPEYASGLPLSSLKTIFRKRYHCELSETVFGHTKLSALVNDPHFLQVCRVEAKGAELYVHRAGISSTTRSSDTASGSCSEPKARGERTTIIGFPSALPATKQSDRPKRRKGTKISMRDTATQGRSQGDCPAQASADFGESPAPPFSVPGTTCAPSVSYRIKESRGRVSCETTIYIPEEMQWRQHVFKTFIHVQLQDQQGRSRREKSAPPKLPGASFSRSTGDSEDECAFCTRKTRSASPILPSDDVSASHSPAIDAHRFEKLQPVPAG